MTKPVVRPVLRRFLDQQDRRLAAGRLYALTAQFRTPLPVEDVEMNTGWHVLPGPADVHRFLKQLHDALKGSSAEVGQTVNSVRYVGPSRVIVDSQCEARRGGHPLFQMRKEQYICTASPRCRVEMLRVLSVWPRRPENTARTGVAGHALSRVGNGYLH